MELLEQCRIWNDNGEFQKIIDALEAIPAEERTPEMDSELARAYNNLAQPGERALYEKAIALLEPHEEYFKGDHNWNFRMGYAYYYLDQEGPALRYFEQALDARPGDEDTQELIDDCRRRLALPRFEKPFRQRVREAWTAFEEIEGELRAVMDADQIRERGEEVVAKCEGALNLALSRVAFEIGFNGEKYELILSPEGVRSALFPLVYFRAHAPKSVLEHWNIWVGRQPSSDFSLRCGEDEIRPEEVQVWAERQENGQVALAVYCEKLLPLQREDAERAWWLLSTLTDQVLGEVNAIAHVAAFDLLTAPKKGPDASSAVSLAELPQMLKNLGLTDDRDGGDYLEHSCLAYELDPVKDPDADWRLDVCTGSTRLPALINDYMSARSDTVDRFHADGIAAGFFVYPLKNFAGEDRAKKITDFRDALQEAVTEQAGEDAVAFLGGAVGLYHGYLDFIAWDLIPVLQAARNFLEASGIPWAQFHAFRRDVGGVDLAEEEPEPQVDPETGSLLSVQDIRTLESFEGEVSSYFGKMYTYLIDFIKAGVSAGRFTQRQARRDLQIALWYSYACNNLDEYTMYYRAAQWMPASESGARGCGMWYYRYSCALMYCGRLEEALEYSERGVREEPNYPWGWLQLGKLRAHFGDKAGALEAVERGLSLEPGDYEFLTLRKEIGEGASIEQMEYHWINPDADRTLQAGLAEDADDKQRSISCITVNGAGLVRFIELFQPNPARYEKDAPYCTFPYAIRGREVDLVFRMNEAGLSKLDGDWLRVQKERLDSGLWSTCPGPGTGDGELETALFDLDYGVTLIYRLTGGEDVTFQVRVGEDGTPDRSSLVLLKGSDPVGPEECYTQEEMEAVEEHIASHFGPVENVFHELVSPDIHVDICVVEPSEERNYYTLVTMGMGAHRMKVPEELSEHRLERAELAVALPPDWKLDADSLQSERWYWPIGLLKVLARLPIANDTWLGWGHTMDKQSPFAENTQLCGAILITPQGAEEGAEVCTLPGGEEVNFYQVIPLYRDEMEYKQAHSAEELLDKMEDVSFVIDPERPDAADLEDWEEDEGETDGTWVLDDAGRHLESIREKHLPVDELSAYNHMAFYLRWCIEQDLMSLEFLERCWDTVEEFKADPEHVDLRPFLRDALGGQLFSALFDEEGEAFARYYYGGGFPYYPADFDDCALNYFGPERYYSGEFQEEAYLFLPFDERLYQAVSEILENRFENWKGQEVDETTREPSPLDRAVMAYLNCECRYFPSMRDDDPITAALSYARRLGVREGFVPVLVRADETLWECLIMNSDPEREGAEGYAFDPDRVAEYRNRVRRAPVEDGKALLGELAGRRREETEEDGLDWSKEVLGEMTGGEPNDRFTSYWNPDTGMTCPLILAKIPVRNPWEVFAWLPFGGWNDCPDSPELMAAAKYWFERFGAVPAALTHDELEFLLPAPIPREKAMETAVEQYGLCPDLDQNEESIGALADALGQSKVWYFWWD